VAPAAAIGAMVGDRRTRRWCALVAALAAATFPQMIFRQDLKQYTAEALVALCLVWLFARADETWSVRRVAVVAGTAVAATTIATTAVFVSAAGFAALCVSLALTRRRREAWATAVAGAFALVAQLAFAVAVTLRGPGRELRAYWRRDLLPTDHGVWAAVLFVERRVAYAFGNAWPVVWPAMVLVIAGIWITWRKGQRALALIGPLLLGGLFVASAVHVYPFLDTRTSLFLMTILVMYGAVAVATAVGRLVRSWKTAPIAVLGLAGIAALVGHADARSMRPTFELQNVRDQIAYVAAHREPGDVILVGFPASYGFAYYWPRAPELTIGVPTGTTVTFSVSYPRDPTIVVARGRAASDVAAAMEEALARAGPRNRVWIVLSHDYKTFWRANMPTGGSMTKVPLRLGRLDALIVLTRRTG
jgi:hypothetical protein